MKFHMTPREYMGQTREEKAFMIACIQERIAEEKKQAARRK
ncbi:MULTISPECIES: hypothetical protein [Paenibacillus]|jgi:hypothetical protein|nr:MULTISPECIES: hypothetical protein [Paenibacillus]